jgi:hypothetical protein
MQGAGAGAIASASSALAYERWRQIASVSKCNPVASHSSTL